MKPDFDPIARPYRWLEYLSFGPMLERCRFHYLSELTEAKRALILGDGDGRFLARLLAVNAQIYADVIDFSPAMLRSLRKRVAETGAQDQITLHCIDAREFTPSGRYDLVVTHFFLDCFTTEELHALAARISPYLCPKARWVVSEFAIPSGTMSLPAKWIVRCLYVGFGILTGLKIRRLPDHRAALTAAGLTFANQKSWLNGLLVSELWQTTGNQPRQGALSD